MVARIALYMLVVVLVGCSTAVYRYEVFEAAALSSQAKTQSAGNVSVTAAVPGREQAKAIFGFPIYDRGIQPVWLSIRNESRRRIRYAPTGTDRDYFSPLEVAYMHRKGYSKEARAKMERRLYEMGMPRRIEPGETASGFVFTNAGSGTKGLLVDIFGGEGEDHSFAFFLDVPGFVPDHAEVDFQALYEPSEFRDFDAAGFREVLASLPCCTSNHEGKPNGLPLGVVIVARGKDMLKALLRAGWYETEWTRDRAELDPAQAHYLFGRLPDAVFRNKRQRGVDRNELHIWLAPWLLDGEQIWMALIVHFIDQRNQLRQVLFGARFDPDMDDGRNYMMQNFWYSQGLKQIAWVDYGDAVLLEQAREDFLGAQYFTDGHRTVLWLSGVPVSLLETRSLEWDEPPELKSR